MGPISDIRPAGVQPGMALSIYGRNFKDKQLTLKIGDKIITDGREIDAEVDAEVDKAIHDSQEINETLLRRLLKTLLARLLGTSPGIDDAEVDAEVDKAIHDSQEINETLLRRLLKTLLARLLGTSFRVISENLIKVKIPSDEEAGTKKLSLKAEDEDEVVATFVVLLSKPGEI